MTGGTQIRFTRSLRFILGLFLTIGFLSLLVRDLELIDLWDSVRGISISSIFLACAFLTVAYCVRIVRWWWILSLTGSEIRLVRCVWPFLSSVAVNNVLPFRAGDVLRVFGFRKDLKSNAAQIFGTLIVERTLDLIVLLGFFYVGLDALAVGSFPDNFVRLITWLSGICVIMILSVVFFVPSIVKVGHQLYWCSRFSSFPIAKKLLKTLLNLIETLEVLRSVPKFLVLVSLSATSWFFEGAVFLVISIAFDSTIAPIGSWFALASGTLATFIPSTPGHIGTFDYFTAIGFVAYGDLEERAVATALVIHAILWVPLTTLGISYLVVRRSRK